MQNGARDDDPPGATVVRPQRLQDGKLPLQDAENVLGGHCPDPGEPGIELCLAMVNKGLPVGEGLDEDVTDGIP